MQGVRSRRVLVVDDSYDTADSFAALVKSMGHDATFTTNPLEAVAVAKSFQADVAFLDLSMPHIDGFKLAGLFRAAPELKDLTLVAVSGFDGPEHRTQSRRAGFDAHVAKPLDPQLLKSIFTQFSGG